jgi:hypothetical protein
MSDPSGHCATYEDGSENREGDENAACWELVYEIHKLRNYQWFKDTFPQGWDHFYSWFATSKGLDSGWMQTQMDNYYASLPEATVPNMGVKTIGDYPEFKIPGHDLLKPYGDDFAECLVEGILGCGGLIDDAALGVAGVAVVVCAGATGGGCLVAGAAVTSFLGGVSGGITGVNYVRGNASAEDLVVGVTATVIGGAGGPATKGLATAIAAGGQVVYNWYWSDTTRPRPNVE